MIGDLITEEDLAEYAAATLEFAVAMHAEARRQAGGDFTDAISIITSSMMEAMKRGKKLASMLERDPPPEESLGMIASLRTMTQTIAAASLGLLPIYEALEELVSREAMKRN